MGTRRSAYNSDIGPFPGSTCDKFLGRLCRLERMDGRALWETGTVISRVEDVELDYLLDRPWEDATEAYYTKAVLPLEEFYLEERDGFVPAYDEYRNAVVRAIHNMNSYEPLHPGSVVVYGDSERRWRAQAVAPFVNVGRLPTMPVESDDGNVKLVILETVEMHSS